jgi:hypothetical protein
MLSHSAPAAGSLQRLAVSRTLRLASLLVCFLAEPGQSAETNTETETWEVVLLQGKRIGYTRTATRTVESPEGEVRVTEQLGQMQLLRGGQQFKTTVQLTLQEGADGSLLRLRAVTKNPPASETEIVAERLGDQLQVHITSAGRTSQQNIAQAARLKSSAYLEHLLQERDLPVGESVQFETFDPQLGQVVTISAKRFSSESTKVWSGEIERLERLIMTNSGIPGVLTTIYFRPDTKAVVKTAVPLLGMESFSVTEAVALAEVEEFDQLTASFISLKTEYDLSAVRSARFKLNIPSDLGDLQFPVSQGQSVEQLSPAAWELRVQPAGPRSALPKPDEPAPGPEYLEPSRCIECTAPLIQQLCEQALAGVERNDSASVAVRLEKFVSQHITRRDLASGLATALEVAESRSGDCTEHAVLLVALLRAAGIPARVVLGFVHSSREQSLIGHMWTEAWIDGGWVPLDATRARGGTGGGHIKINDSALAGAGTVPAAELLPLVFLQGRLKVELLAVEP